MLTDPISDLLTRIRNASRAHHQKANVPYSRVKEGIARVLKEKKFIVDYKTTKENNHDILEITLDEERSDIHLRRISKPGQRIYVKKDQLKPIRSGLGITIVSTPKGVMSNVEAKKQNLGGELLCEIY